LENYSHHQKIPELDEAIRQYENGEVERYNSVEEAFRALNAISFSKKFRKDFKRLSKDDKMICC